MSETVSATSLTPTASKGTKKSKSGDAAKKARAAPNHPPISEMVNSAISKLNERGGSSAQAIKKYIAANYKVDVERVAPFIRKYLKNGVTNGTLVQTKGKGASGSFKMSKEKTAVKPKAPKPTKSSAEKPKKTPKKKTEKADKGEKPKKPPKEKKASPKKPSGEKKPKAASEKKSKVEKKTKAPKSAKPKSPKKKAAATKPKKASPAKKASTKK